MAKINFIQGNCDNLRLFRRFKNSD